MSPDVGTVSGATTVGRACPTSPASTRRLRQRDRARRRRVGAVCPLSAVAVFSTLPLLIGLRQRVAAGAGQLLAGRQVAGCGGVTASVPSVGSEIDTPVNVTLPSLVAVSV